MQDRGEDANVKVHVSYTVLNIQKGNALEMAMPNSAVKDERNTILLSKIEVYLTLDQTRTAK